MQASATFMELQSQGARQSELMSIKGGHATYESDNHTFAHGSYQWGSAMLGGCKVRQADFSSDLV
jgi:hypothetical protein